jgi:hypothetical protein
VLARPSACSDSCPLTLSNRSAITVRNLPLFTRSSHDLGAAGADRRGSYRDTEGHEVSACSATRASTKAGLASPPARVALIAKSEHLACGVRYSQVVSMKKGRLSSPRLIFGPRPGVGRSGIVELARLWSVTLDTTARPGVRLSWWAGGLAGWSGAHLSIASWFCRGLGVIGASLR